MTKILCALRFVIFLKCAAPAPLPIVNRANVAVTSTCTITLVPNGTCPDCVDLILSSTCTAADLFVDVANADFHVPSINAPEVNNAQCLAAVLTDADGNARPTPGRGCDVGAYQFQSPPQTPPSAPTGLKILSITR